MIKALFELNQCIMKVYLVLYSYGSLNQRNYLFDYKEGRGLVEGVILLRELEDQQAAPLTSSLFWHQTYSFGFTKAFLLDCSIGALFIVIRQTH